MEKSLVDLNNLIPDVKFHILKYLNLQDRLTMRLVCRSWRDVFSLTPDDIIVLKSPKKLPKLTLDSQNMVITCCECISEGGEAWVPPADGTWVMNKSKVRFLKLNVCNTGWMQVVDILKNFSNIQTLQLEVKKRCYVHFPNMPTEMRQAILNCEFLENFHCEAIDEEFLEELAEKRGQQLRELYVKNAISSPKVLTFLGPQLTGLSLFNLSLGMRPVFPNLKKLDIGFSDIDEEGLILSEMMKSMKLTHLKVSTMGTVSLNPSDCQNLVALDLTADHIEFHPVNAAPHMPSLTSLFCDKTSWSACSYLPTNLDILKNAPKLRTLKIQVDIDILDVVCTLTDLRFLDISLVWGVIDLSDLNNLIQLEYLVLDNFDIVMSSNCPTLCLPKLEALTCIGGMTLDDFKKLTENCPKLQNVYIELDLDEPGSFVDDVGSMLPLNFNLYVGRIAFFWDSSIFEPRPRRFPRTMVFNKIKILSGERIISKTGS